MDEFGDGLYPLLAGGQVPEAQPCLVAELVGKTETAGHEEAEILIQFLIAVQLGRFLRGEGAVLVLPE